MKIRKQFRFSWFVFCYAVFTVFAYEAEQGADEKSASSRAHHARHPTAIVPDTRGQGPPATVRHGTLPHDSLERTYDKNYMLYDYHEHNMLDDDEWHDYFND